MESPGAAQEAVNSALKDKIAVPFVDAITKKEVNFVLRSPEVKFK